MSETKEEGPVVTETIKMTKNQIEATLLAMYKNAIYVSREAQVQYRDLKESLKGHQVKYTERFTNMKPVCYERIGHILFEIYVWNAWNLLAVGAFQMIGHMRMVADVMSHVFGKGMAFLLALVFIPAFFYSRIKNESHPSLQRARFELLLLCIPIGLLSGYSMMEYNLLMYVPPAFIMPLFMGVVSNTIAQSAPNRIVHIVLVIGAGAAISLSVAILLHKVDGQFLIFFVLNILVYIVDLQIKVAAAQMDEEMEPLKSLLISVVVALALDYIITYVTPMDAPPTFVPKPKEQGGWF